MPRRGDRESGQWSRDGEVSGGPQSQLGEGDLEGDLRSTYLFTLPSYACVIDDAGHPDSPRLLS